MHPKLLKPTDCASKGFTNRSDAIGKSNLLTKYNDAQHSIIKIDGLWYVYDVTKHNTLKIKK